MKSLACRTAQYKPHRALLFVTLALWLLTTTVSAAGPFPLTLTDDLGQRVTLAAPPQRIISLSPSNTEVLFAIGVGERVVAIDSDSNYPPAAKKKENVGSGLTPSLERIAALQPDLVLLWDASAKELQQKLRQLGFTAVTLAPQNLAQIYESITMIGRLTGAEAGAEAVVNGMKSKVARVTTTVGKTKNRPLVFYEVWPDPLFTAGPGSFMDELIGLAGGRNVAANTKSAWPVLSLETVIASDPEVILTPFDESMSVVGGKSKALWAQVKAVRDGRVHLVDQDLVSRPGPRLVDGLLAVAKALHPGLF